MAAPQRATPQAEVLEVCMVGAKDEAFPSSLFKYTRIVNYIYIPYGLYLPSISLLQRKADGNSVSV